MKSENVGPVVNAGPGFNRTIEELKLGGVLPSLTGLMSFNRTIEELKFDFCFFGSFNYLGFNRTIEELKFGGMRGQGTDSLALIEP